jgi:hypothetical protein
MFIAIKLSLHYEIMNLLSVATVCRYPDLRQREFLLCPYHGKHPDISPDKDWKLTVSACCIEFKEIMEAIKKNFENKSNWIPELQG